MFLMISKEPRMRTRLEDNGKSIYLYLSRIFRWCVVFQLLSHVQLLNSPMDHSMPSSPVLHYLLELGQICVHWVNDAIKPSYPLLLPSPFAFNPSISLCLLFPTSGSFPIVDSLHQMAKYWKCSFSIRPSSEYSGFISFRIDWLDSHGGKELPEWKEITIGLRTWEFKKSQQRSQSCFWWFCRVGSFSDLWRLLSRPFSSVQFSSVTQSCLTLCDPMNHSTPGLPVHHHHPESTQIHVDSVSDAI